MKVKVIKKFIDKETRQLHDVGEELEVTNARYNEICKVGNLVEIVEGKQTGAAEEAAPTTTKKTAAKKGATE